MVMLCSHVAALSDERGAELFGAMCADCHGPAGQGSDYHATPLAGDLPVAELARVIADTMPEDDPEACVGEDALAVARHAHAEFYSPLAQARLRPPRRELSRLTVRQYEQSLIDLFGDFHWRRPFGDQCGVKLQLHQRINVRQLEEKAEIDLQRLEFRLTELKELSESFRDPEAEGEAEFGNKRIDVYATANAGIWAPTTGRYEFFVRSPNSVELHINGSPVINAKVRSEGDTEVRGATRLVGGRVYPLRLNTSRINQADIELALGWRRPGGVDEVVPARFLSPGYFPQLHATQVAFPPDDRSVGYVRGASISPEWLDAVSRAALAAAREVVERLPQLLGKKADQEFTRDEASDFCHRFARIAFRSPVDQQQAERYVDRFFIEQETPATKAVEQSVLAVLTSPRFLYPGLTGPSDSENQDDYATASRLALALWDSMPDRRLRELAGEGKLSHPEAVRHQARRLLRDERTKTKLNKFFEHWLRLDHVGKLSRDPERFPDFDDRVAADMRASLDRLIEEVVWRGDGDLRQLFLTEDLYVNQRLAEFLAIDASIDQENHDRFVKAPVDTRKRSGVVSHPFMVTALAYYRDTSPIHRGVFLARNVLGRSLRPPPEAVAPLAPELAPELTTRERVSLQTSPGACQGCHVLINDLGFTLEEFDAVGRFREIDTGKPVDPSGGYVATDGRRVAFRGARELAEFLANEEDMHRSFVTQLFEHLTKQPMLAYGVDAREELLSKFRESGYNVRELLVEAATLAAMADQ